MIIAELNGKIPSKLNDKEDILTSNVFSFFKYSDRQLLKDYLLQLGLDVTLAESENAEFIFWPSYDDGTEPDLIIICGKYYLLFEAKLYSDFSPKTLTIDSQIKREIKMGKLSANNVNKEFAYITITAEYHKTKTKYSKYENKDFLFIWTNWQMIASFIHNKLEENDLGRDKAFAVDLYSLLVKKKLRNFKGLNSIILQSKIEFNDSIFYSINTSKYKGEFSGFLENLREFEQIKPYQKNYKKSFFKTLTTFKNTNNEKVFYNGK
ncbi:MAG: hypothetical protein KAR45_13230 [Desulfobacteraceae bacterium]|nr:hypothetical protein [Desulfobacteraceae bacterium]